MSRDTRFSKRNTSSEIILCHNETLHPELNREYPQKLVEHEIERINYN